MEDTEKCNECGGRTALITGIYGYQPHDEPYKQDVEEDALVKEGECWIGAYKCDVCGNIQGFWTE